MNTSGSMRRSVNKNSAVAEMGDRFAIIDIQTEKLVSTVPFSVGELGPHLTQCHLTECGLGRGLLLYQVASWSIQPFGHNTPTLQTEQRSRSVGRKELKTITRDAWKNMTRQPSTSDDDTWWWGSLLHRQWHTCMLNHCLEWYKWVLTNSDHDRHWFNTLIPR